MKLSQLSNQLKSPHGLLKFHQSKPSQLNNLLSNQLNNQLKRLLPKSSQKKLLLSPLNQLKLPHGLLKLPQLSNQLKSSQLSNQLNNQLSNQLRKQLPQSSHKKLPQSQLKFSQSKLDLLKSQLKKLHTLPFPLKLEALLNPLLSQSRLHQPSHTKLSTPLLSQSKLDQSKLSLKSPSPRLSPLKPKVKSNHLSQLNQSKSRPPHSPMLSPLSTQLKKHSLPKLPQSVLNQSSNPLPLLKYSQLNNQ